MIQDPSSSSY